MDLHYQEYKSATALADAAMKALHIIGPDLDVCSEIENMALKYIKEV
jgi:hypothetical protein